MSCMMTIRANGSKLDRPLRVEVALILLWTAWVSSLVALIVNQFFFHGSGIGPGPALGILSLILQSLVFVFVALGHSIARTLTLIFLVLAALPLQMLGRLIAEGSMWSATYTGVAFLLKATAVFLLFTGPSRSWFASRNQNSPPTNAIELDADPRFSAERKRAHKSTAQNGNSKM